MRLGAASALPAAQHGKQDRPRHESRHQACDQAVGPARQHDSLAAHQAAIGLGGHLFGRNRQRPLRRVTDAGARLKTVLAMGASKPWPEALEALTGERQLDANAIADYFAPLKTWLDEQNTGRKMGW